MNKLFLFIVFVSLLQVACIKEDFFGFSSFGEIKSIEVSNQASQANIDIQNKNVIIEIPGGVDLSNIAIQQLTLSSFALSDKNVGDPLNLTKVETMIVTAEDGTSTTWTIEARVASDNPQLPNSDFNKWYQTNAGYFEPGESESATIWGTGNPGTQLLGLLATTPLEIADGNLVAKLETLYNGDLAATFKTPISAGSIFTGKFNPENIDISDPEAAIDFGTPFSGRPKAFKIKYSYDPGLENKDKNGNLLGYGDACDIYILLEVRNESGDKRLATAWFRNDEKIDNQTEVQIDFTYGELPADAPEYSRPADGKYVSADSASFIPPSHLTFVASSSADGKIFAGAVGSILFVDDLELIYE